MTVPPRFARNSVRIGTNFYDLDDMQPSQLRYSPYGSRSYQQEYQYQDTGKGDTYQTSQSGQSKFCSKACLIGLLIGLAIGVVLVIVIAVPVGLTRPSSSGTNSSAYNCIGPFSSTPNWIGTFQMDNGCSAISSCCCFSNQVTVSQTTNNQMQITGSVTGQCTGIPSTITLILAMPTGFQASAAWFGQIVSLLLSQDSSHITLVNIGNGYCTIGGLKITYSTAGSMKSMNMGLIVFILPITIGMMKW